ncbi:hypothetical protein HHI36_004277 [Cryptolaemus montrouzieri]|uniref:Uncharacterized protein n=1 Tax=Cryptolaemus montrouzieri TaxID=559131 RepID=A0ABD2NQQ6_9CUCU
METFDTFQTATTSESNIDLPGGLEISKFSYARSKEIEVMRKSLASAGSSTKLAFQKLPRHMRRRAMSHNPKRLPRRLREIHLNQMKKSGIPPKLKRPSRKYRRKPRNLLEQYTRRQSKIKWLTTHIWHAKRFHMIEKWGYKLPERPCDKAFTACYRATKNHCLLQDISYFQCVEISGKYELIIEQLKKITNEGTGLSIGSRVYAKGCREGRTTLYEYGSDLKKPIGIVEFLWRFKCDQSDKLWIWIHAAFYEESFTTLLNSFGIEKSEKEQYVNEATLIKVRELRTELNRFRLSGTLSNSVIQNCFKIYDTTSFLSEWFKEFYKSEQEMVIHQNNYWNDLKSITSTNILPPHIILPVIVYDPRLNAPRIRTKSEHVFGNNGMQNFEVPKSGVSPLWDEDLRKIINSSKVSNSEVAKLRSSILVPATDLTQLGYPVPIILIQKPGNRVDNLGYSSGWDIILPSSWAQPIWLSLIMCGARSGGLREFKHHNFEIGKPDFLYPDTFSGKIEEVYVTTDYTKTYFRKPPNKRTNFNKFRIACPFEFKWGMLIENWLGQGIDSFMVLRKRNQLSEIQQKLSLREGNISVPSNCLVPIRVQCNKGVPKKFAIICVPKENDLTNVPIEPKSVDSNQKKRKILRNQHKTLLKRLRQRRKRDKQLGNAIKSIDIGNLKEYSEQMKKLWIPDVANIKNSCSREVLGFITEGGFSFSLGKAKGIGYIAGAALNAIKNLGNKILIRNINSRQYYIAKLSVIVDL